MAAPRRVIALVSDEAQRQQLQEIARSRTEAASRVERARIILEYLAEPWPMRWRAQLVSRHRRLPDVLRGRRNWV